MSLNHIKLLNYVSLDIFQECIFSYMDYLSQINIRKCNKKFYKLKITNLYITDYSKIKKLIDDILLTYNPKFITRLMAFGNDKITDKSIIPLINLIELNISYNYNITDNAIKDKIYLKKLIINGCYKLTDNALKNLDLIELNMSKCILITDNGIKHMKNLKILDISFCYIITPKFLLNLINIIHINIQYSSIHKKDIEDFNKYIEIS